MNTRSAHAIRTRHPQIRTRHPQIESAPYCSAHAECHAVVSIIRMRSTSYILGESYTVSKLNIAKRVI